MGGNMSGAKTLSPERISERNAFKHANFSESFSPSFLLSTTKKLIIVY